MMMEQNHSSRAEDAGAEHEEFELEKTKKNLSELVDEVVFCESQITALKTIFQDSGAHIVLYIQHWLTPPAQ